GERRSHRGPRGRLSVAAARRGKGAPHLFREGVPVSDRGGAAREALRHARPARHQRPLPLAGHRPCVRGAEAARLSRARAGRRAAALPGNRRAAVPHLAQPELLNLALVAAGLVAWRRERPLLAAVLVGLAAYSKPYNVLLALPLGIEPLLKARHSPFSRRLAASALRGAVVAVTVIALFGLNKAVTGEMNYQG